MWRDPNRSLVGPRLLLITGVMVAVAFVGVPVGRVVAAHDPRPGSDQWTDGERALVAEIDALVGPSDTALAASGRVVGPGLAIPGPPRDAAVEVLALGIDRGITLGGSGEVGGRRSPERFDLVQTFVLDAALEDLTPFYETHFAHRAATRIGWLGIPAVEFSDSPTAPERRVLLYERAGELHIEYRWSIFVEDHMGREALYERFGRWIEPPHEWEAWNFEELSLAYRPNVDGDFAVRASIEPELFSFDSSHTGVKTFAMSRPFPVDELVTLIVVIVAVAVALRTIRLWGRLIRQQSS